MTVYRWVLLGLCMAGFLGCVVFVVRYQLRSRGAWIDSEAGRWMMIGRAEKGALFALVTTNQAIGDWPGRESATLILFSAFVALTWWPSRLLSNAFRPHRTDEEVHDERRTHP